MKTQAVLLSVVLLAPGLAGAQNLLLNGDFNSPASTDSADNWTPWSYNNGSGDAGWANHENNAGVSYDGSHYLVAGGFAGAGGGFYQVVPGVPGLTYTLSVLSGADAWWLPYGEMRMFFLDAGNAELGSLTQGTVDPAVYGENYDIAHPWQTYTLTATAPAGTAQVKVEFASTGSGSVWFENAVLTIPEPGTGSLLLLGSVLLLRSGLARRQS